MAPSQTTTNASVRENESQPGSPSIPTLKGLCQQILHEQTDRADVVSALAELCVKTLSPDMIVQVTMMVSGEPTINGLNVPTNGLSEELRVPFARFGTIACQSGTTQQTRIGQPPSTLLIAVPVTTGVGSFDSIVAIFTAPTTTPDVITAVMELIVTHLAIFDARYAQRSTQDLADSATAVLDLVARIQNAKTVEQASQELIDEVALFTDTPGVAIALRQDEGKFDCDLVASTDNRPELKEFIESCAVESLIRGQTSTWPALEATEKHALLTLRQLATETDSESVLCIPLKQDAMHQIGVLVLWGEATLTEPLDVVHFLEASSEPIAKTLKTVERTEKSAFEKSLAKVSKFGASTSGRFWIVLALIVASTMAIPMPYWVECECVVQPVTRRFVAAPFDAKLERAFVEPGDVVEEDQLLARLDGREIEWELSGITADLHRAAKERDGHLATQKYGAAEVSKFELERLKMKQMLQQSRSQNLEIRSPLSGIIIAGDIEKTEGAPLKIGQTLFEIAPLESMAVEISIPEQEIAYISKAMNVEIALDAYTSRRWQAEIDRVQPRAELVDQSNVFVTEITLDNPHDLLRPGMRGRAWIRSDSRPLGWNLFHRGWEGMMIWMGL